MNFNNLINKLNNSNPHYCKMLTIWLDDFNKNPIKNYDKVYGFIRGLKACYFITDSEESQLIDLLIDGLSNDDE